MRTSGGTVSIHGVVVPSVVAAALFSLGESYGAPGVAPGSVPEEQGHSQAASEAPGTTAGVAPEDVVDSAAIRLRWRHEARLGRVVVRIGEIRGVEVLPFMLPVRLQDEDGSLEDVLFPITDQGEICEVRCEEEPVAVSLDPEGALERVIAIEALPSGGPW